jgi:secreted PhoX family phosphatase
MPIARRSLLVGGTAGVGLVIAGIVPSLNDSRPSAQPLASRRTRPSSSHRAFPPLEDDPAGVLALPSGFTYAVVTYAGQTALNDGLGPTPSGHDGTAVFNAGQGRLRLIQNHELNLGAPLGVPHVEGTVYDAGAVGAGGCTVIETDNAGTNHGEWVGLSGTLMNCAGGPTPWGSWLSCEETERKSSGVLERDHGYVFEVFTDATFSPQPIKAFGRFAHEALAIDRTRTRVYLSEDASTPNGLFYRWTAPDGVRLRPGIADQLGDTDGTLAAMAILMDGGSVLPDVAYLTEADLGRPFPVRWVDVPERDGQDASVRTQFADGVVTRGKKFEGVSGTDDGVYVVNSYAYNTEDLPADAVKHDGMVWFYSYADETITLVTYFPHQQAAAGPGPVYDDSRFDGPDNVTVTPWGTLVLAEDGVGAPHVLSSVPGGPTYAVARNQLNEEEFTGPCFSADGRTLFVNIMSPGITLAINGPWERYLA